MTKTVSVHEAKTHLSRLLELAVSGEEVVIAKSGRPVARLVGIEPLGPRPRGVLKGRLTPEFFEPLPPEELDPWQQ